MDPKNTTIGLPQLNEEQNKKLEELTKRIQDPLNEMIEEQYRYRYSDKGHLIRLLIAREWKLQDAFTQWKRWVEWRKQYRADNIKIEEIQSEINLNKAFWNDYDKEGNPVIVIKAKRHFPNQSNQETLIRFFLYQMDIGMKLADEAKTGKITVLWDREGVTSKNFDSSMFSVMKKIVTLVQDNYAERLHKAYILYPNFLVKTMMGIIRPFLSEKTKSKLVLLDKLEQLVPDFGENFKIPGDQSEVQTQLTQEDEQEILQIIEKANLE